MYNASIFIQLLIIALGYGFEQQNNTPLNFIREENKVTLKSCGISKNLFPDGDRIVGGRDALFGEFPWQVSLQFKSLFIRPTHLCGGTILNELYIITAAHCVHGFFARNFEVAVGVDKLDNKRNFLSYEVSEIIKHKDFERETFRNDIALLRLKTPINFPKNDSTINGICLPEINKPILSTVIATGWGNTVEDGDMSPILQAVVLPVVPHIICEIIYGDDMFSEDMLCAGNPYGGVDTCQGDSGGPLIQKDENGRSTLVGIVSWGIGCARAGLPGIYASVPHFIDWINQNIK